MGSIFSPKAPQTPIPQQAGFDTQTDSVAGTQVQRVQQPDGTYAIVRSQLPQSPEQQAYTDALKSTQASALNDINNLTNNFNLDDLPDLKQYVNDYQATALNSIDTGAQANANQTEKTLARFGQADSTAAIQQRGVDNAGVLAQKSQLGRDLSGIVEQGRQQEIGNQSSLYNTATNALNGQQAQLESSLGTGISTGLQQQGMNQSYNNTVSQITGANNTAQYQADQAGLGSLSGLATLAGKAGLAYATGGMSLAVPGAGFSNTGGLQGLSNAFTGSNYGGVGANASRGYSF